MTVATYTAPNFTTQLGNSYKGNIDGGMSVFARIAGAFAPHEQSTPNMTVRLDAGYVFSGSILTEVAAQSSAAITAPTTNPRIDRIVVDAGTGVVSVVTGVQGASPVAPAIPAGKMPVAQVLLQTTSTVISNGMLTDERLAPGVSVPPVVSGFVAGKKVYCYGDTPAHATTFNVVANIGAAFETVGPTGSGATNIWTALDSVPADAVAVKVRCYSALIGQIASQTMLHVIAARKTGSSAAAEGGATRILWNYLQVNAAGNPSSQALLSEAWIPIDTSRRFDLYLRVLGTMTTNECELNLTTFLAP